MPLYRIIAVLSLATAVCMPPLHAQSADSITLQSKIDRVQPMTGIVLWSDSPHAQTDSVSMEYRYCGYNEVVNEKGEYDFSSVDRILDEIASRNHQAILRFYFVYVGKRTTIPDSILNLADYKETVGKSEGKITHFCDWSHPALQNFVLSFYSRFAERYDQDPRIAFVQTGFGLWAEYHIYDGPRSIGKTFPTKSYQEKFLKHLNGQLKHLPWSISIDAADYDYSPLEDNADLLVLNFGTFDDSFLCKQHPKENAVNWKILGTGRWKRTPAGGEFSYYNRKDQKNALAKNGPNGVSFAKASQQFHISYMIGNDQPKYRNLNDIRTASLATGYRFEVTKIVLQGDQLRLEVTNNGVAPLYRNAYFSVGKVRSDTSLRLLLPGQTKSCVLKGIKASDVSKLNISSDAILPTQSIQFAADLSL